MPSLKEIRKRIDSVKKTQKTTSAMKMVSAAKLKRAENQIHAAQPYATEMKKVISSLSSRLDQEANPLFQKSAGRRTAVILLTSDRGLCGGFNSNLCKKIYTHLQEQNIEKAKFTIIGRKGRDYFKRFAHPIIAVYTEIPPQKQLAAVAKMMNSSAQKFINGELDRVYLAYNTFQSVLTQKPTIDLLLPIEPPDIELADERGVLFEPSPAEILDTLLQKYVQNQIYTAWLSTNAGEHASRMTAMDSATKNAGEMIDKLQLFYNRTRQAAITTELIEIISGAESL